MEQEMNQSHLNNLLEKFKIHFPTVGNRRTGAWKIKRQTGRKTGFSIECRNGTRNYIVTDSCKPVLDEWNKEYPNLKLKEVSNHCIEDDEVWTWIIWEVNFEN